MKIIYVTIIDDEWCSTSGAKGKYRFTLDDVYFENQKVLQHELNKLFSKNIYAYNSDSLEFNDDFNTGGEFYTGYDGDWDIIDYEFTVLDENDVKTNRKTIRKIVEKAAKENANRYNLRDKVEKEHYYSLTTAEHKMLSELLDSLEVTISFNKEKSLSQKDNMVSIKDITMLKDYDDVDNLVTVQRLIVEKLQQQESFWNNHIDNLHEVFQALEEELHSEYFVDAETPLTDYVQQQFDNPLIDGYDIDYCYSTDKDSNGITKSYPYLVFDIVLDDDTLSMHMSCLNDILECYFEQLYDNYIKSINPEHELVFNVMINDYAQAYIQYVKPGCFAVREVYGEDSYYEHSDEFQYDIEQPDGVKSLRDVLLYLQDIL